MPGKRKLVFLVVLTMLFNLSVNGCAKKSSAPQKPKPASSSQKPPAPKSAEAILKDINTLIGELDQKSKTAKAPWMTQPSTGGQAAKAGGGTGQSSSGSGQSSGAGQSNSQNGGSGSGQGQGQGSGSAQGSGNAGGGSPGGASGGGNTTGAAKQNLSPEGQKQQQWQKISMSLMNIHRKWNELEPDAMEAGLPPSSLQEFEDALGRLTQSVSGQNTEESLAAAIDLYDKYTAGISQIFSLSTPPELYQVQYRTMAALSAAGQQDWAAAGSAIEAALEPWGLLKAQAKKADKKLLGRCDFSLQDLKSAIDGEDFNMVMIKGEIAKTNLKQLEKSLTSGGAGGQ